MIPACTVHLSCSTYDFRKCTRKCPLCNTNCGRCIKHLRVSLRDLCRSRFFIGLDENFFSESSNGKGKTCFMPVMDIKERVMDIKERPRTEKCKGGTV